MSKQIPPYSSAIDPQPRAITGPHLGRIHDRVLHVLAEVDTGYPADRSLANTFRRARDLGSHDRQQVKEEVYGLLRRRRLAQDQLLRGLRALKKSPELFDPPMWLRLELLTHLILEGATLANLTYRDAYAVKRIPNLFQRIAKKTPRSPPTTTTKSIDRAAIEVSLPTWLYQRLADGVGIEKAQEIAQALLERAPLTLRVDHHRSTRSQILQMLAEQGISAQPTPIAPHGIIVDQRIDLRNSALFQEGLVEVQDEGSQLVAMALGAQPGEHVMDACAGAGGKTLALWANMRRQGRLVAIEPDKKKHDALKTRLPTAGRTVEVMPVALEDLPANQHGSFDRILVDAPCTGTGTLRRHPDLKWRLKPEDLAKECERQIHLLGAALPLLKPGGIIVYATCSVLREENETIAEHIVASAPELNPHPLGELWGQAIAKHFGQGAMCRIGPGPHANQADGFFIAAFVRASL
ncbi:MAG: RsmB/NOP family class I SAM-dependent RNA methyltransferase [Myxococcales bacterium]|nr:RsmB/NOP family class I SAM-dependent RNA methyltransferase [Myxococcales bacterium]